MVTPLIQHVSPYRLRGLGLALITLYIFLIGAVGGSLTSAWLTDEYSTTVAVFVLAIPGQPHRRRDDLSQRPVHPGDLSLAVAELQEEMAEHRRRIDHPDEIPVAQVVDIDFSYGDVQILFDLSFEVRKGEVLALLGTNGAGKSTILKVITGLVTPERGVVRLNGRTITFTSPEQRAGLGIEMLPGGTGVFRALSVRDNLLVGAYRYRHDGADVERRIAHVFDLFPTLADAGATCGPVTCRAASSRCWRSAASCCTNRNCSSSTNCRSGWRPSVVQQLLAMIEQLRRPGRR